MSPSCALAFVLVPALGFAATLPAQNSKKAPQFEVRIDPCVELMSIIFRLAGNSEYNRGRVDVYTKAVDAHFAKFKDHAAVEKARTLRRLRGVSYDAVAAMAVHLKDAATLQEKVPFDPKPDSLDKRWNTEVARDFLVQARKFVDDTGFMAFHEKHAKLHDITVKRMRKVLSQNAKLGWFDEFFGTKAPDKFHLALGLLNGGNCYGPRVRYPGGQEEIHCVFGVWKTDADGNPVFDQSMLSTVVHEFCHSYCNRLVDKHWKMLEGSANKLFPHVADGMRAQAYTNPKTMMYESLVRASVVRYLHTTKGKQAARLEIGRNKGRHFLWIGELSEGLAQYEQERDKYPTLDAAMPGIAKFFDAYAKAFEEAEKKRPKIVSVTPRKGAKNVDPSTTKIVVVFDRPMRDGSWAVVGSGPNMVKTTGKPSYDQTRKVLTIPVKLQPNWRYEYWLNGGRFMSFASEDGANLRPVKVTFRTGEAK